MTAIRSTIFFSMVVIYDKQTYPGRMSYNLVFILWEVLLYLLWGRLLWGRSVWNLADAIYHILLSKANLSSIEGLMSLPWFHCMIWTAITVFFVSVCSKQLYDGLCEKLIWTRCERYVWIYCRLCIWVCCITVGKRNIFKPLSTSQMLEYFLLMMSPRNYEIIQINRPPVWIIGKTNS